MKTKRRFKNGKIMAARSAPRKVREAAILKPHEVHWGILFDSLERFSDDFMDNRNPPEQQVREN